MDVNPAFFGQQRGSQKYPEMAATFAHLQRRLHSVLTQVVLELQQVVHRIPVVGIDSNPFAALSGGVDGIETDRDFASKCWRMVSSVNIAGTSVPFLLGRK
jgi:hypothetical protein